MFYLKLLKKNCCAFALVITLSLTGCGSENVAENTGYTTGDGISAETTENGEAGVETVDVESVGLPLQSSGTEKNIGTDSDAEEQIADTEGKAETEETTDTETNLDSDKTTNLETSLAAKHNIDMELIYQYPELPTGCESVSLTMILRYYGFDISKTEIAENYLVHSDSNYVVGFVGNPFFDSGCGCYAPGMTDTANAFLSSQNSDLTATNISGAGLEELFKYIAEDKPVLIWATCSYTKYYSNDFKQGDFIEYNEKIYDWTSEEHCVVLSGYDLEKNTVTLYDPISGIITMDKDEFNSIYEYMYSMAVLIE